MSQRPPERADPGPIIANPDADRNPRPKRQEALDLKVESLENLGSMLELDPQTLDPNFKYRWVNENNLKVARARAKGYRAVDPEVEEVRNAVGDSPEVVGGVYKVGDVVLMRTPISTYRGRRKAIAQKRDRRLKGPERKFRKEAEAQSERYGAPIEVVSGELGEPGPKH